MEADILPTLASNVEQLNKTLESQEQRSQEVEKEVNEFRKRLKATVDERCDKIIDELRQKYKKQTSDIGIMISELEKQIKDTELLISIYSKKVREGGLDLIEYCKVTQPTTDIPSYITYTIPTFVPSQNLLDSITKLVGNFKWEAKKITLIKPTKPSIQESENVKQVFDIELVGSFRTDISGTSVTPTGKDAVWVAFYGSDTMTMYDITGKNIRSVTVKKGASIFDIAVKKSDDVIACCKDNTVRLMKVNGVVDILIDTMPYTPLGVCLNEREEIVVCMAPMDYKNHVAVYSPDGKKQVRRIVVKDDKGRQLLTDPTRVVMNGEYFSVMNHMSDVVTCDEDGKVRWMYDGSQTQAGWLNAWGMCIDQFRNLLISDWSNSCVHYLNREGGLIQILLNNDKHGIKRPWGVGMDDDTGTVWVGGGEWGNRRVWIYRYLQK